MWSPQYLPPQMGNLVNVPSEQENVRFDDEIIPFADTPQISRFGPISRYFFYIFSKPSSLILITLEMGK